MAHLNLDTIWPRPIAAADEMATTLFRTAFSHDVVEVHDMSTGLYDDRGNLMRPDLARRHRPRRRYASGR